MRADLPAIRHKFATMTEPDAASGCVLWMRSKNRKGYGQVRIAGRLFIASRLAWEVANGPIPAGMMVLHHCDVPSCVNPEHLFLGTNSDNQRDSVAKGRHAMKRHPELTTLKSLGICPRGEQCRAARLTADDVREIRRHYANGSPAQELAIRFGVLRAHIYSITSRRAWRHVA